MRRIKEVCRVVKLSDDLLCYKFYYVGLDCACDDWLGYTIGLLTLDLAALLKHEKLIGPAFINTLTVIVNERSSVRTGLH